MNWALLILFVLGTAQAFHIQAINGSSIDHVFVVKQRQLTALTEIRGSRLSDLKRAIRQEKCSKNVNFKHEAEIMAVHDYSSDDTKAYITFNIINTEELGIFKVCFSTEETGLNFEHDAHIDAAIISMYQLCHTFGATAKAIRNCVKSSGDTIEPRKEVELIAENFGHPKYQDLFDYYVSSEYKKQKEIEKRDLPPFARNEWDWGMKVIPGGKFMMGSDCENARADPESGMRSPGEGEYPLREATIRPFKIDRTAVTNGQFREFVRETGYKTDAEEFGWSFVFEFTMDPNVTKESYYTVQNNPWWHPIKYSYWRLPYGPKSRVRYELDHPVVHVSWRDAQAFCSWKHKRLPTEGEWEWASRGGLSQKTFPWGNEYPHTKPWLGERKVHRVHRCNLFQGQFPYNNTAEDGYYSTSPVQAYLPNNFGLYGMVGNVWEWVNDEYTIEHDTTPYVPVNPKPAAIYPFDKLRRNVDRRVSKGGSWICFYPCARNSARQGIDSDSSTSNLGFRCAADLDENDTVPNYEIHHGQYVDVESLNAGVHISFEGQTEGEAEKEREPQPDIYYT